MYWAYTNGSIREVIVDTFEIYVHIVREVRRHVMESLERGEKDWGVHILCMSHFSGLIHVYFSLMHLTLA